MTTERESKLFYGLYIYNREKAAKYIESLAVIDGDDALFNGCFWATKTKKRY